MKQFKMFGIITSVLIIGLLGIITIGCDNPSGGGKDDSVMYTVTFNSNGGSDVDTIQVESGDTITLPAKPTKTGYDFSGWFLDNNTFANVFGSSTAVNEDIIVYAKWIKVYEIGDTGPAGGIIFYKKTKASDGWQYLEVAPAEKKFSNIMWGAYDQDVTGTQTEMGTGKENTRLIVEYLGTSESGTAAQLCNDLTFGGYTDWFLPSADELDSIYWNPVSSTLWDAGILQYQLLSSSQYSTTDAYGVSGDATFSIDKDDDTQSAVAIRQF